MRDKYVKKQVALFGAGNVAREKFFFLEQLFEIECFYDNNKHKIGGMLYHIPIRKWEKKNSVFVIITVDSWKQIALQLEEEGLELGKDYLPFYIFDSLSYSSLYYLKRDFFNGKYLNAEFDWTSLFPEKKIVVIYGNCQTPIYENVLMLNKDFKEKYILIRIPKVYEYDSASELVKFFLKDVFFWKAIQLFIYQFVSKENNIFKGLATDYCLKKLNTGCKRISIVSLEFDGYFPQIGEEIKNGVFPFRDTYVDTLMMQNIDEKKIVEMTCNSGFIPDEEIERSVQKALTGLKKKDFFADIKIYDYVEQNYEREQLCYSPLHPCGCLLKEYAQRILYYLGLNWDIADEDFTAICGVSFMRGFDLPVYPSVVRKLGLLKYSNRYYFNRQCISKNMFLDFKRCIEIYITAIK